MTQILSRDELLIMLKNPNFLLLDVRDPNEVAEGMIDSAKTVPGS
jgi:rhodanese-related sulfurtransferase